MNQAEPKKTAAKNTETAKTEVHIDLKSKTMADLRCAKEDGVWAWSSLNALIRDLNSSLWPGGQKAKSKPSLVSVSKCHWNSARPTHLQTIRGCSLATGADLSPGTDYLAHKAQNTTFQKSAEFWFVVDGEPLKCFSRGLSSDLSLTHSAHCENEFEKVRPEAGN